MLNISHLAKADCNEVRTNSVVTMKIWHAEAHGMRVSFQTFDLIAEFWVSPIWNMREKGVALIDSGGHMVKCERSDR